MGEVEERKGKMKWCNYFIISNDDKNDPLLLQDIWVMFYYKFSVLGNWAMQYFGPLLWEKVLYIPEGHWLCYVGKDDFEASWLYFPVLGDYRFVPLKLVYAVLREMPVLQSKLSTSWAASPAHQQLRFFSSYFTGVCERFVRCINTGKIKWGRKYTVVSVLPYKQQEATGFGLKWFYTQDTLEFWFRLITPKGGKRLWGSGKKANDWTFSLSQP